MGLTTHHHWAPADRRLWNFGLDFGEVEVGETSAPQAVTLTNSGDADATGLTFNAPSSGFEADASLCGDTLPADGSCEVSVTFTPIVPGPIMATLTAASAEGASADLPLAGTGVGGGGGFTPMALAVDPEPFLADGNGVFEPGELVEVAPTWRNDDNAMELLTGAASDFDGTDGGVYFVAIDDADYGNVEPGGTASCRGAGDTGLCYFLAVNDPAVRPATHWEASFDESLSDTDGTTKTWSLHIGESFTDVPRSSPFYTAIETLLHNGVTGGCTATEYCPTGGNTRGQMAVFLLKA
ncbi:MAG: choice-of-anchor D domain-containing protein, partial [Thermoanaerobaculia bacterium]